MFIGLCVHPGGTKPVWAFVYLIILIVGLNVTTLGALPVRFEIMWGYLQPISDTH